MSKTFSIKDAVSVYTSDASTFEQRIASATLDTSLSGLLAQQGDALIDIFYKGGSGYFSAGETGESTEVQAVAFAYVAAFVNVPTSWKPATVVVGSSYESGDIDSSAKKWGANLLLTEDHNVHSLDTMATMTGYLTKKYASSDFAKTLGLSDEAIETAVVSLIGNYDYVREEGATKASGRMIQNAIRLQLCKWFHQHATCTVSDDDATLNVQLDQYAQGLNINQVTVLAALASTDGGATWSTDGTYVPSSSDYTKWLTTLLKNTGKGSKVKLGDQVQDAAKAGSLVGKSVTYDELDIATVSAEEPQETQLEPDQLSDLVVDYAVEGKSDDIAGAAEDVATKSFATLLAGIKPERLSKDMYYEVPSDAYAAQLYAAAYDSLQRAGANFKKLDFDKTTGLLDLPKLIKAYHKKFSPSAYAGITKASLKKPGIAAYQTFQAVFTKNLLKSAFGQLPTAYTASVIKGTGCMLVKPDDFIQKLLDLEQVKPENRAAYERLMTSDLPSLLQAVATATWPEAPMALPVITTSMPAVWIIPVADTADPEWSTFGEFENADGTRMRYGSEGQYDFAYQCAAVADNNYSENKAFNDRSADLGDNMFLIIALIILLLIIVTIVVIVMMSRARKDPDEESVTAEAKNAPTVNQSRALSL